MSPEVTAELLARAAAYDRCWVDGRPDDLREFLHPDVVFAGERFERLVRGRDACVQSYSAFLGQARVHGFSPSDYVIDVAETAAVMTYRWTIDYEMNGQRLAERGQELLVWVLREDRWEITWRTQRPDPAPIPQR